MKSLVAVVVGSLLIASASASADIDTATDVTSAEGGPLAAPVPPEAAAPAAPPAPEATTPAEPMPAPTKARMTTPDSRTRKAEIVKDDGDGRLEKKEDTVAGGKHWRIKTNAGAVHVWVPPNYDRSTAGTVVYVHGYWTDADGAWRDYRLAQQFRASRQNALFIVPDAPSNNEEQVKWTALKDLRRAIARANIVLPDGPVIVMGHSGAFRTVMQWVDHRLVEQIILLDAMYAGQSKFDDFIAEGKRADQHKLVVVGADTAEGSASFVKKYKFAVAREKMPGSYGDFTKRERRAKLLYIRSQYGHMQLVTSSKVIPVLLRLTPLKSV
jgi:hypothetical protein